MREMAIQIFKDGKNHTKRRISVDVVETVLVDYNMSLISEGLQKRDRVPMVAAEVSRITGIPKGYVLTSIKGIK